MKLDTLTINDLNNPAVRRSVEAFLRMCRLADDPKRVEKRIQYLQQALNTLGNLFRAATNSIAHFVSQVLPTVRARIQMLYDAATGQPQPIPVTVTVSWTLLF